MGYPLAQIFGDDLSATFTVDTTNFEGFPGSTLWTAQSGGYEYVKPSAINSTSIRFYMGDKSKGIWDIAAHYSFSGDAGNKTYHIALFKNGTKLDNLSIERKIGTAGDIGAAAASGFVMVVGATDIIDLRVQAESSGTEIDINHMCINMKLITTSTVLE